MMWKKKREAGEGWQEVAQLVTSYCCDLCFVEVCEMNSWALTALTVSGSVYLVTLFLICAIMTQASGGMYLSAAV